MQSYIIYILFASHRLFTSRPILVASLWQSLQQCGPNLPLVIYRRSWWCHATLWAREHIRLFSLVRANAFLFLFASIYISTASTIIYICIIYTQMFFFLLLLKMHICIRVMVKIKRVFWLTPNALITLIKKALFSRDARREGVLMFCVYINKETSGWVTLSLADNSDDGVWILQLRCKKWVTDI